MPSETRISQYDHFIPVSTRTLINRFTLNNDQSNVVAKLKRILEFEFYQKLETLKLLYQPFNPDRELQLDETDQGNDMACMEQLDELMTAANYSRLDQQQIEFALEKISPYGLKISIDFSIFKNLVLYYRGKSTSVIEVRDWKSLYLKKKSVSLVRYQRLFLVLQYKDPQKKPGIHLKLFKDILRMDLEMLFPESKVEMKVLDKTKLAITGGGGTAGGLFATISKITAAVSPWTILIAVAGFAMLIWRQVSKIFIQKTRYMATLAQNLYFHNLNNNAGAITYLIDQARQEEIKEMVLAYALLVNQPETTEDQLDTLCEDWFKQQFDIQIDFDILDAVDKLKRFDVLETQTEALTCRDENELNRELEQRWNSYITVPGTTTHAKDDS